MQTKLLSIFEYQNSRIARYIRRNLVILFFAIFIIIGLVVLGNRVVLTVQESFERGIPVQELIHLVSFNMIRDVTLILTISLFLAIILSISQLYKNSEAIVMNSLGLSDKHFIAFIQPIVLLTFVIIAFLSIYAVPWAKLQKNIIQEEIENASEFSFITEGEFAEFKQGDITFYASESKTLNNLEEQYMEEIFIYSINGEKPIIILAPEAQKYTDPKSNNIYLRIKNGVRYQGIPGDENINILNFDSYDLEIYSGELKKSLAIYTKIEGQSTVDLIKAGGSYANAELQWRLSQPITILILSFFGIFLGKTSPRGGKGVNILMGVIVFMFYYNGLLVAKRAIELGQINLLTGFLGVHLLVLMLLILLYQFRNRKIANYIDKVSILNIKEKTHA